ncbi:hypothetical protein BX600DRAFT_429050 [Xylariales sp. PMI_506]|nr:hypothetical protein BX600DRAFT_429050 [Xylariales sp. PMI_506]
MTTTTSPRQSIRYRRLNASKREFRLLEIRPVKNVEDRVVCRLITVPLSEKLQYLALSSLYGDPSEAETIFVDGIPITITAHLGQALRHIRTVFYSNGFGDLRTEKEQQRQQRQAQAPPNWLSSLFRNVSTLDCQDSNGDNNMINKAPLRLWVDVLCINHADDREMANQTLGINQIYASARLVVGWLGLKGACSDAALDLIEEIDDAMPLTWGDPGDEQYNPADYAPHHRWLAPLAHTWADSPDNGAPSYPLPHWAGGAELAERPYFQRGWILEELAHARFPTFLVGDTVVPWMRVLRLNLLTEELREKDSNVFPAQMRTHLAELPLGTVNALLDDLTRRRQQQRLIDRAKGLYTYASTESSDDGACSI